LDCVNVQQSLRRRNESKVDGVGWDPDSPRSHDGGLQVGFQFLLVIIKRLALDSVQVSKKAATENGIPNGLIDEDFAGDSDWLGSRHLGIQKSVKVVTGTSVEEESKRSQTDGTHNVVWLITAFDEILCQDISDGESGEGCQTFGQERLSVQQFVVSCPKRCHFLQFLIIKRYLFNFKKGKECEDSYSHSCR